MKTKSATRLFNAIAPIYGLFFRWQQKEYRSLLAAYRDELPAGARTVLDIGCGTGALLAAFKEEGYQPVGTDQARRMLDIARRKTKRLGIPLHQNDGTPTLPFGDKSFDLVVASYVAHGMKTEERKNLYKEMNRIARSLILLHDYNQVRSPLTSLIEWLEHGDYFRFIREGEAELKELFQDFRIVQVGRQAAWYLCKPTDQPPSIQT